MHFLRNLWLGFAILAAAAAVHATPITFTETFTASGVFEDGLGLSSADYNFYDVTFTFTGMGDTSAITYGSEPYLILSSATISTDLNDFGGAETITNPTMVVVLENFLVGFAGPGGLVSTPIDPLLMYDLSGPVTAQGYPYITENASFATSGGALEFNGYSGSSTFSAVTSSATVPEPSTMTLVGSSLLGLAGMVGRHKRRLPERQAVLKIQ